MPPPAVLVEGVPSVVTHLPGWEECALHDLPDEPFRLTTRQIAVGVDVIDETTAGAVLLAAARGVGVVVAISLHDAKAEQFIDELARVADVRSAAGTEASSLSVDHTRLLDALAEGLTVAEAARRLGLSRRTAVRRLAEAREQLGATSTTEAVRIHATSHRAT